MINYVVFEGKANVLIVSENVHELKWLGPFWSFPCFLHILSPLCERHFVHSLTIYVEHVGLVGFWVLPIFPTLAALYKIWLSIGPFWCCWCCCRCCCCCCRCRHWWKNKQLLVFHHDCISGGKNGLRSRFLRVRCCQLSFGCQTSSAWRVGELELWRLTCWQGCWLLVSHFLSLVAVACWGPEEGPSVPSACPPGCTCNSLVNCYNVCNMFFYTAKSKPLFHSFS